MLLAALVLCSSITLTSNTKEAYAASNQEQVFAYLTTNLGLNAAAACGIMANIQAESSFNPNASGGGGTFYGICQWGYERKSALYSYCSENGYEASSLEGQLHYLEYEVRNSYGSLYKSLLETENDASGAYQAGYDWCYYFERPGNRESVSASRGASARDKFWPEYCDYKVLPFISYIETADGTAFEKKACIEGWAIEGSGIARVTAVVNGSAVEGKLKDRKDIAEAYPDYPDKQQGFTVEIMPKDIVDGENTATLFAYTASGEEYEIGSVTFTCTELDRTAPIVSDIQVSDVSEFGYTVTCRVSDESGISRVLFPTWTVQNGQDDLQKGWRTSELCLGVIEGDTVTYRVNVLDHNCESGDYVTHIYVYDNYENCAVAGADCKVPEGAVLFGDIDGNRAVTSADALMALRHTVGLIRLNTQQLLAGDVDGDEIVGAFDALLILRRVVNLEGKFPAETAYYSAPAADPINDADTTEPIEAEAPEDALDKTPL